MDRYLSNKFLNIFLPISIGVLAFLLILDYKILFLKNVGWLNLEDPIFHYLGWEFFRIDQWRNPIGLNPNYGIDISSSIVFSDSIPLLAILFKVITHNHNGPIQYFGLWLLTCFIFQAYFSFKLISTKTNSLVIKVLFAGIMMFIPAMLARTNIHIALAGHFLLLASIYLIFSRDKSGIGVKWLMLLVVSLGIHFYLFFIVFVLYIADLVDRFRNQSSQSRRITKAAITLIFALFILAIFAWQFGYMEIKTESSRDIGFGNYQINLLGLFNSSEWSLFQKKSHWSHPSFEGLNYFGFGIILLLLSSLYTLRKSEVRKLLFTNISKHLFLLLALIFLFLLSVTHIIDVGRYQFIIDIPDQFIGYANIIRSSGRLFWPIFYIIVYVSAALVLQGYSLKTSIIIFLIAFILQVVDTSKGWVALGGSFNKIPSSSIPTNLKNEFWRTAAKKYKRIELFPVRNWPSFWANIADYAYRNGMQTGVVRLARVDQSKIISTQNTLQKKLADKSFDGDTLYLFQEWKDNLLDFNLNFDPQKDLLARVDDIIVLAPNWKVCESCVSNNNYEELKNWKPEYQVGKEISYSNKANAQFLLNGWVGGGDWGYWSLGERSRIVVPISKEKYSKIKFNVRSLVAPSHPQNLVNIYIDGQFQNEVVLSHSVGNIFFIQIPKKKHNEGFSIIEFVYKNPTSPQAVGYGNGDDRKLAIGIENMTFIK
jgi:hypothetical protein